MEPTLGEALVSAFGESLDPGTASGGEGHGQRGRQRCDRWRHRRPGLSAEARALVARANQEFSAAQEALKAGDFAEYGRRIDLLEQAPTDLQRLQQQ